MDWFWGKSAKKNDDPVEQLDPSLKEFLDSQEPRPYEPASVPPPPKPSPPATQPKAPQVILPDTNARRPPGSPAPRESLFPDGRYAHLWDTYTPQSVVEANTTHPLERIVNARKDRLELLMRASLENCAFEEEARQSCLRGGSRTDRVRASLTMCRQESLAFNRCYKLQAKFLQALGYLGQDGRTDAEEERIQMHADKLYHRMMDYEASVAEARRLDMPVPPLGSVFSAHAPAPEYDNEAEVPDRVNLKELKDMTPQQRELEVRAAQEEAKMSYLYSRSLVDFAQEMGRQKKKRQEMVSSYVGDPIAKFIIPDSGKEPKKQGDQKDQK